MKNFSLKPMLLLCALMAGAGSVGAQEQQGEEPATKIKYILTAPKDIKATDIVVIADTAALVAIQNDAADGKAPTAGKIKLNDNKDQLVVEDNSTSGTGTSSGSTSYGATTTDFSKLEWKVQADGDLCNFYVETTEGDSQTTTTKFLFVTNADDGLRMGTPADGDVKAFGLAKDEGNNQADFLSVTFPGEGDAKSYRYVGVKSIIGIINSWQTKASIDDDIKNTKIAFFVKKESTLVDVTMTFPAANYQGDYKGGNGSFTAPALTKSHDVTVTYSSSNEDVATVDASTGDVNMKKRGTVKITASAAEQNITEGETTISTEAASTSYTLRIDDSTKKGSENNPYTPTGAINAMKNLNTEDDADVGANYFVEGYVAKIGEVKDDDSSTSGVPDIFTKSDNDSTLTYYISNDGVFDDVTKNTLKISLGYYTGLKDLTDRVISVGDKVKVVGPLVYASATPASSSFSIGGSGSSSSSTTPGSSTTTEEKKEFRMDATNYIHVHTPVLVKKDMQMVVNQEIEEADFATEDGLYTISSALSGSLNTSKNVTITSSNEGVAKVGKNGKFNSNEVGTTVITVTVPATVNGKDYDLVGKFTVTVVDRNVYPATADKYELVTDASTLTDDDKLLIMGTATNLIGETVTKSLVMSTTQDEAERGAVEVTVEDNIIKNAPSDAQVVTYKEKSGKYYLNVGNDNSDPSEPLEYYLYASSSDKDELKTGAMFEVGNNGAVTITIDGDNNAKIKFGDGTDGTSTHNLLKFDGMMITASTFWGANFTCFEDKESSGSSTGTSTSTESSGTLPKLFRYVQTNSYDVTINASGYKTFVAGEDFKLPEGLQAYIVSTVDNKEGTAKLTEVTSQNIKANTPYILKGTAKQTYTLTTTTTEATAPAGNKLEVSDDKTTSGVYVLATHEDVTAFYKWDGGLLGSGRVYLPATSSARQIIFFDEEATGIADVKSETATDNRCYNLNGQRVAQPQKGLYIVNGKKIIKK